MYAVKVERISGLAENGAKIAHAIHNAVLGSDGIRKIENHCVECPWHNSIFDLRDGSVVHGPATYPEPAYDARMRDGQIEVRLRPAGTGG